MFAIRTMKMEPSMLRMTVAPAVKPAIGQPIFCSGRRLITAAGNPIYQDLAYARTSRARGADMGRKSPKGRNAVQRHQLGHPHCTWSLLVGKHEPLNYLRKNEPHKYW